MTKEQIEAKIKQIHGKFRYTMRYSEGWWKCQREISELVKEWRKISDLYEA
jgi:hypothetical protein